MTSTDDDTHDTHDTLSEALADIARQTKAKEDADKAAAKARLDEIGSELLPPPGQPWGDDGHPIEDIVVGKRLRQLDEGAVQSKMASIREAGLLTSITVTLEGFKGKPPRNQYRLRAGLHRLEACRRLGWTKIPAIVVLLAGPRADLIEIDENLEQTALSPALRAAFTARRKEIYLTLYPETAKGKAQGEGMKRAAAAATGPQRQVGDEVLDRQVGDGVSNQPPTFTEDTAQQTGRSERSIERDAERGEKVAPDVLDEITGTAIDTGQTLDELKDLPPEQQRTRVEELRKKAAAPKRSSKGKPTPKGPPVEHHGEGGDSKLKQDMLKRLNPLFDEAWLIGSASRDNAAKMENVLAERNVIPVSDRKRDPRKHLRDLQAKAKGGGTSETKVEDLDRHEKELAEREQTLLRQEKEVNARWKLYLDGVEQLNQHQKDMRLLLSEQQFGFLHAGVHPDKTDAFKSEYGELWQLIKRLKPMLERTAEEEEHAARLEDGMERVRQAILRRREEDIKRQQANRAKAEKAAAAEKARKATREANKAAPKAKADAKQAAPADDAATEPDPPTFH